MEMNFTAICSGKGSTVSKKNDKIYHQISFLDEQGQVFKVSVKDDKIFLLTLAEQLKKYACKVFVGSYNNMVYFTLEDMVLLEN